MPFDEIAKIAILSSDGEYAVRASDPAGQALYEYVAMDLKKAQQFADVLAALSKANTSDR